jgi:hypothetical protein
LPSLILVKLAHYRHFHYAFLNFDPVDRLLVRRLLAAETQRAFADTGHSLDFISKAFECLD